MTGRPGRQYSAAERRASFRGILAAYLAGAAIVATSAALWAIR